MPEFSVKRFEFQKALLEKGLEQIQKHILHLDEILFKTKASAVTVWVALMEWSITAKEAALVPLGAFVIIGFWLLEAQFKGVQIQYLKISRKLMDFVNDSAGLDEQFSQSAFRAGTIYPVALHQTELERVSSMMIGFLSQLTRLSGLRFVDCSFQNGMVNKDILGSCRYARFLVV